MLENGRERAWTEGIFPSAEDARLGRVLPVGSRRREAAKQLAFTVMDGALGLREVATREGRRLDAGAAAVPRRQVLVGAVYGDTPDALVAAVSQLHDSRHEVRFALGARNRPDPALTSATVAEGLGGGKFANLNRALETVESPYQWLLLLDDDVELPPRFLDRMLGVAEALQLDLAQPAQTRSSDPPWRITRRRPALARRTRFVEIGPVVLMRRRVVDAVAPFNEQGMGWGLCLHWASLAERSGWRLGIVDALPVRHTRRPTASAYSADDALAAAREFLATHEHIDHRRAEQVVETYRRLPAHATGVGQ